MADSLAVIGVDVGDEDVVRQRHVTRGVQDLAEALEAGGKVPQLIVGDPVVDVVLQGFEGAGRNTVAGEQAQRVRAEECLTLVLQVLAGVRVGPGIRGESAKHPHFSS